MAQWLSQKTGRSYRLLSEAEWEYCCRAGTHTKYAFGDTTRNDQAQFAKGKTVEVGAFPANAWGLHDMHGNVWEWCDDHWHTDYNGAPQDGSAWQDGDASLRVLRGGSWHSRAGSLRSAHRIRMHPNNRTKGIGFRLSRTV
jgi:formylglycine-generating enzyme required for sulfatase activity